MSFVVLLTGVKEVTYRNRNDPQTAVSPKLVLSQVTAHKSLEPEAPCTTCQKFNRLQSDSIGLNIFQVMWLQASGLLSKSLQLGLSRVLNSLLSLALERKDPIEPPQFHGLPPAILSYLPSSLRNFPEG